MLTNRLYCRAARFLFKRGGFTLVELLVVIGIIAILAGVALGPITNGIKKAKESAAVQEAHALGLAMYSAANDNSQVYPDSTGSNASDVAKSLLAGGYVTDPNIFYISGGKATKFTAAASTAVTAINNTNLSWDFAGASGSGLSATSYQFMPLLWTSVAIGGGTQVNVAGGETVNTIISAAPSTSNVFGTAGMAVFYINNASSFITASVSGGTISCTIVTAANNSGGLPSTPTPTVNGGGG